MPLQLFPNVITSTVIDGFTALRRMGLFLQEESIEPYVVSRDPSDSDDAIVITEGKFVWSATAKGPAYKLGQKRTGLTQMQLVLALPLAPIWLPLWLARAGYRKATGASGAPTEDQQLVQREEVRALVEKLGRQVSTATCQRSSRWGCVFTRCTALWCCRSGRRSSTR